MAESQLKQARQLLAENNPHAAVNLLQSLIRTTPETQEAWALLSQGYRAQGMDVQANEAHRQYEMIAHFNRELQRATALIAQKSLQQAEQIVRTLLSYVPNETRALALLARVAELSGSFETMLAIHTHREMQKPTDPVIVADVINALSKNKKFHLVIEKCNAYSTHFPNLELPLSLKGELAIAHIKLQQFDQAEALYKELISQNFHAAICWLRLGNLYKITGDKNKAIDAFLQAIKCNPGLGEAYWNLANLKTYRFSHDDISQMHRQLSKSPDTTNRMFLLFALGNALDAEEQNEDAFSALEAANKLAANRFKYRDEGFLERCLSYFDAAYFDKARSKGHPSDSPIFILGLPRSGSTLVEQIIASHSEVDGTYELTEMVSIARELENHETHGSDAPYKLDKVTADEVKIHAERYLEFVAPMRTGATHFIDKLPANYQHIGLIKTLFPNAKIIDVRRTPQAIAWSLYKHVFSEGHGFSYRLDTLADYINQHDKAMAHWHTALPGQLLRIDYEELVQNFDETVSRLLSYCGLKPQQACYEYHANRRPVMTPSAEQVRQPIYTQTLDDWRRYEDKLREFTQRLNK